MPDAQPDAARTSDPSAAGGGGGDGLRRLVSEIEWAGYYPALITETVEDAVAGEAVTSSLVHQETTFDTTSESAEVRRHVTILALTPTRLVVGHTDEHGPDDTSTSPYATTSTEAIPLDRIAAVVVTRVVADPAKHVRGALPREVTLAVGWGSVNRVDLEPAGCPDPECDADHGYVGSVTSEDLALRVSEAAEGRDTVRDTLRFAADLSAATTARTSVRSTTAR